MEAGAMEAGAPWPRRAAVSDRLSQRDFHRLAGFIQEYSGIRMPPNKMTLVEGRLRRRVRVWACPH